MKYFLCFSAALLLSISCTGNRSGETYKMVRVEAGSFYMGSESGNENEKPVHPVHITRPFYIGVYEVTFDQYDLYTEETKKRSASPETKNRGDRPVMGVNWIEAVAYCNWLSEKEGFESCYSIKGALTECNFEADGYRLPTEAEWEYAARGGNKSRDYLYAGSNRADDVAWFQDNSEGDFHRTGLKEPNELGLYDMSGNMWEWCWDYWEHSYYEKSEPENPQGPLKIPEQDFRYDVEKSRRSSRWLNSSFYMRVTSRSADFMNYRGDNGMRLVRTVINPQ